MAEFGIEPAQLIEGAYIDLLADKVEPNGPNMMDILRIVTSDTFRE